MISQNHFWIIFTDVILLIIYNKFLSMKLILNINLLCTLHIFYWIKILSFLDKDQVCVQFAIYFILMTDEQKRDRRYRVFACLERIFCFWIKTKHFKFMKEITVGQFCTITTQNAKLQQLIYLLSQRLFVLTSRVLYLQRKQKINSLLNFYPKGFK